MLDDYSIYIDPEEDEVFFTALLEKPIITISKPNNSLADLSDEEENALGQNVDYIKSTAKCESFLAKAREEESITQLEGTSNLSDIYEDKENCVSFIPTDLAIKTSPINKDKNILTAKPTYSSHLRQNNGNEKLTIESTNDEKTIPSIASKENVLEVCEFKTPLKRTPLKLHNERSVSKENKTSARKPKRCSKVADISINEFELSADINESLISWSSVDVNVQLENLMGDLDFDDEDNDAYENELLQLSSTPVKCENDDQLKFSWTPTGLNVCLGSQRKTNNLQNGDDVVLTVPSINIIEASPVVAPPPSPLEAVFNRPKAPIRFRPIYSSGKKLVASASSSSSGSSQSFTTPARTPLSKTKGNAIISNIPKPSVKKVAAKSLQFSHIESPISNYIYDKSTPLVSNVKGTKLTSSIPGPSPCFSKAATKPLPAPKQLPHARYQKGIPLRQEKATESRLPRLGGNQMRVVAAVPNARVISHSARQSDVSVLVSSPAKIHPKQI